MQLLYTVCVDLCCDCCLASNKSSASIVKSTVACPMLTDIYHMAGNIWGRKPSWISRFCGCLRKFSLRNLGVWHLLVRHKRAICESFLRENHICESFLPQKLPATWYWLCVHCDHWASYHEMWSFMTPKLVLELAVEMSAQILKQEPSFLEPTQHGVWLSWYSMLQWKGVSRVSYKNFSWEGECTCLQRVHACVGASAMVDFD